MFPVKSENENASLPPVKAVDFGFVGKGRPTWDLAYFFAQSVNANDYEADLAALQVYYDALCAAARDNSRFDASKYTFEFFSAEFFRIWGSHGKYQAIYIL